MDAPRRMGILSAEHARGKKSFSFEYDVDWLKSKEKWLLDPDLGFYSGRQFPGGGKENFGMFLDCMPDTWGRTLMKRRAAAEAKKEGVPPRQLHEIDFLLGVHDLSRMGALRFKLDPDGPFLNDNNRLPVPPWSSVRELQHGIGLIESDRDNAEVRKWLTILLAPGSSLGGARPKANVLDEKGNLWIAKFPSKHDTTDKAAWEHVAYSLAIKAGIWMSASKTEKVAGKYHTFFTQRFDRKGATRIHFASAMSMTGNNEDTVKEKQGSYLDLAMCLQNRGTDIREDLAQLWRRLVFNIATSNTDDHLRNHGFILGKKGWRLSPAYDINPSVDKEGLSLSIDGEDHSLDFDLARSVGEYFRLSKPEMDKILKEVLTAVKNWRRVATANGIPRAEQEEMAAAFRWK